MIGARTTTGAAAAAMVAAAIVLWHATSPSSPTAAPAATPRGLPTAELHPPADLDVARDVARDFAVALYRDDLATARRLADRELASRLTTVGADRHAGPAQEARVEAVTTEDLQPDEVLLQVVVRRTLGGEDRLETLTASLVRTVRGWKVTDVAF